MKRYIALILAAALINGCGPNPEKTGKQKSSTTPLQNGEPKDPASPLGATANGHSISTVEAREFSPELAAYASDFHPPEPSADWRTALSDGSVSAGVKEATVKKLGEDKNEEAVPVLVEHLMEIGPGFRASAQNWRPCRNALIQIGEPAVKAVSERFLVAETSKERFELFYILQCISGGDRALKWLEMVRDQALF